MNLLEDEQEWRFLLAIAQREGEFEMSIENINTLQEQARQIAWSTPGVEAASWAQVVAQCEIAQQLAKQNEHLAFIARAVDNEVLLKEISITLQELVSATNG